MTAAATARTRLERVRASVGIPALALHQIQDDLTADDIDAPNSPRPCAN